MYRKILGNCVIKYQNGSCIEVVVKEKPLDFKKVLSVILFSITGKSVVWVSVYFKSEKYEIIDIHSNILILKLFIS